MSNVRVMVLSERYTALPPKLDYYFSGLIFPVMQMIGLQREKLLNSLIFFAEDNVLHPRKIKIFKLLYFLDFVHYYEHGRAVTDLEYFAWEMGPVPRSLFREWGNPKPDFIQHLAKTQDKYGERLKPRKKFNEKYFSNSEIDLLESLAKKHFRDYAEDMVEKTHFETGPWEHVYTTLGRPNASISYDLVFQRKGTEHDNDMLDEAFEKKTMNTRYLK